MNKKFPRNKPDCCLKAKTNGIAPASLHTCLDGGYYHSEYRTSKEAESRLSMAEQWGSFNLD